MRRCIFYILTYIAFCSRLISNKLYMSFIVAAHKIVGVKFIGKPTYIHTDAMLDPSGGLTICSGAVISTQVIILTHDWSFLVKQQLASGGVNTNAYKSVNIGENSFVGAGAIVLPGTIIGKSCIIGAGAVVKGNIEDYSIIIGNPAKKIGDTRK